jgi:N-acetyl-anhydromuramyl-L-alanine amidase AmpD
MSQAIDTTAQQPRFGRAIDLIVMHCSATPSGRRLGGGLGDRRVTAAMVIDRWHAERGFARRPDAVQAYNPHLPHIGYHYVVDTDGCIESGRRLREVGAHVAGHNAGSVGICLVGGAEIEGRYTARQWSSLRGLVLALMKQLPTAAVVGHRDLSPDKNGDGRITSIDWLKTCPGFSVAAWLAADMQPHTDHVMPEPGMKAA